MRVKEWAVTAALLCITLFSLAALPPPAEIDASSIEDTASTKARSAARTQVPLLLPIPSPVPSPRPIRLPSTEGDTTSPIAVVASTSPETSMEETPDSTATPFPFDTHQELARFIYVDQGTQLMYVFEYGGLLREIPCSTGLPDDDKYTEEWSGGVGDYWGTFFAFGVYADEAWYLYKSAGSILVHSLPYVYRNGYKVYLDRDALGVRPASHGCIRISPEDAAWFTAYNPRDVLMTITDPYRDKWR